MGIVTWGRNVGIYFPPGRAEVVVVRSASRLHDVLLGSDVGGR